jgi:hypothetical protein
MRKLNLYIFLIALMLLAMALLMIVVEMAIQWPRDQEEQCRIYSSAGYVLVPCDILKKGGRDGSR